MSESEAIKSFVDSPVFLIALQQSKEGEQLRIDVTSEEWSRLQETVENPLEKVIRALAEFESQIEEFLLRSELAVDEQKGVQDVRGEEWQQVLNDVPDSVKEQLAERVLKRLRQKRNADEVVIPREETPGQVESEEYEFKKTVEEVQTVEVTLPADKDEIHIPAVYQPPNTPIEKETPLVISQDVEPAPVQDPEETIIPQMIPPTTDDEEVKVEPEALVESNEDMTKAETLVELVKNVDDLVPFKEIIAKERTADEEASLVAALAPLNFASNWQSVLSTYSSIILKEIDCRVSCQERKDEAAIAQVLKVILPKVADDVKKEGVLGDAVFEAVKYTPEWLDLDVRGSEAYVRERIAAVMQNEELKGLVKKAAPKREGVRHVQEVVLAGNNHQVHVVRSPCTIVIPVTVVRRVYVRQPEKYT